MRTNLSLHSNNNYWWNSKLLTILFFKLAKYQIYLNLRKIRFELELHVCNIKLQKKKVSKIFFSSDELQQNLKNSQVKFSVSSQNVPQGFPHVKQEKNFHLNLKKFENSHFSLSRFLGHVYRSMWLHLKHFIKSQSHCIEFSSTWHQPTHSTHYRSHRVAKFDRDITQFRVRERNKER